jgi:hypothetical protein
MINFNVKVNVSGDQIPQGTNGAGPKNQKNRNNHLASEKGADRK